MNGMLKKRWISLYVENQIGVLSKISGLFSAKCYNLESLTVGRTEDPTISRMTIETHCDEETFEQIKKQLNRMVEVIKVIDFTDLSVCMKEILYVKIRKCTLEDKTELFQIAQTFRAEVIDYGKDSMLLEFLQTATKNDAVVKLLREEFRDVSDKGNDSAIRLRFASLLQTRLLQIARLNRYIKTERTLEFSFKQFYTRKIR